MNKQNLLLNLTPISQSVPLFEAIYGKNLISLGGLAAIDNMFSDLNIKGLKILDLGFGLGGVAFYLAEKYQMSVTGIEVYPWMAQYAKDHAPTNLSNSLEFSTYDNAGEIPYKPETFDLVYSKGVLNHVADKDGLFRQIHGILKSTGLFVITDWVFLWQQPIVHYLWFVKLNQHQKFAARIVAKKIA